MNKKKLALVACVMACAMSVGAFTVVGCKKKDTPPTGGTEGGGGGNPSTHVHSVEKHTSKDATCTEVGYSADYYTCATAGCEGKYYSDMACTQQINLADITVNAKGHSVRYTDMGDGTHKKDCVSGDLSFTYEAHVDSDGDNKCDSCKGDMPAAHTHTAASTWESNTVNHWNPCTANDGAKLNVGTHADKTGDGKCDVCAYQMSTPTPVPEGYTANGTYTLDLKGDSGLFTSTVVGNDSGYQGGTYFKVSSGDYLYINMKLQKNKVITLNGKAITSNKADSSKSTTLGISLKSGSTGAVTGLDSEKKITQADGEQPFSFEYTVSTDGTVVLQLTRKTGNTGCEITELSVTISDLGPVLVEKITLNKTTGTLKVGDTDTLKATVTPTNADETGVEWSTSNASIATVDQTGKVTALKKGSVTITATAKGDLTKSATCTYTVTNVAPTGITFDRTSEPTIGIGDSITLTPTVTPANATVKTVSWSASNSNATVDQNGKVTGVAAGDVVITATSTEDSNVKASITVHVVTEIVKVTGVSVSPTSATIDMATATELQLTATVAPTDATNKYVTWSSSDESIAKVDQTGKVTARKGGNVVITATSEDGEFTATCAVECIAPPRVVGTPEITKISDNEFETAYVEWKLVDGQADWFNVYYVAENDGENWKKLDAPLVRQYEGYYRADMVGLKAGNYKMKVVPLTGNVEETETTAVANGIAVKAHDRAGYAFADNKTPGAYNLDGTLKEGAKVIYVTAATAKTVKCTVLDKGKPIECTGFQTILDERQGSGDTTPLCFRLVGTITKDDLDHISSSSEGLQLKQTTNITIEGIGNDATIWGFGMLLRSLTDSEIRNIGIMNFMDDGISIDTDNEYLWIHNNDFFYGGTGSDADQAKGDGSLDTKGSTHMTHAYNHFWDSGKCNLQGMKSEDASFRMTYHHNWYDHSDSRHPRIRTSTVHVYNNYFDGNSKYGVGSTMGSSVFVEANYFRSTAPMRPMMSSGQGTDAQGDGTFSGENGGIIKAFANIYDTDGTGTLNLRTYQQYGNDSDCYEVATRDEQVPSSVTTVKGGTTYNNFDTASDFYKYNVETAEQAKATVTEYAGRLEGGDFKWTFDNAVDDPSYAVDTKLKAAIVAYKGSVVKIGE